MTVSKNVKLVSMVAYLLVWVFGGSLVDLFPLSTAGRALSLLFVAIIGGVTGYILLFTETDEKP